MLLSQGGNFSLNYKMGFLRFGLEDYRNKSWNMFLME